MGSPGGDEGVDRAVLLPEALGKSPRLLGPPHGSRALSSSETPSWPPSYQDTGDYI